MVYAIFSASVLLAIGAIYAGAVGWLYFRQERRLFEPDKLPVDEPICTDPDTREFFVEVPGARLSVAHLARPDPRGVFFFLHGNSGNLKKWFVELDAFRQANFDVVMFDYRGFGKSTSEIESEEQLRADVMAVWQHFAPMYEGKRVVISGQSLGTGLAAGLAAQLCAQGRAPDLTLLVSPYSSMRALASPTAARGVRTVVSGGSIWSLPARSLKPAIATWLGTERPRRCAASRPPWARSSLQKKTASTPGRVRSSSSSSSPPRRIEDGWGLSNSSFGS